jgi:hypothetical protein
MAITNGYATLDELKNRHSESVTDTTRDGILEAIIEAASRWIDNTTGRQFYATSATRYFTAQDACQCDVSDLLTVTTLKTDEDGDRTYEVTWATTDYDLMPYNYTPYLWLETTPNGNYYFPLTRKGVQIVGTWGYASATPDIINEACLLISWRLFKRNEAVFGVSGNNQLGQINLTIPKDEDVARMLAPYIKRF